jgi:hypothetical protein
MAGYLDDMRVPPQPTSLTPVYLNLLQTRAAPPAQAAAAPESGAAPRAERIAPPANSRLPRGSLLDIKA